jgi:TRAP-type uncharacterized transport system substrate-binding protein
MERVMEPMPGGANFKRAAFLWEAALDVAGDPSIPYGGNRDMCITVGSGSGEQFTPWLRMATGSAILAKAVAAGEIEMAFVNPSALLTQAYRGTGIFDQALPVRVVASYPSWDRFVVAVDPKAGIKSIADIKERKLPLRISMREDVTHSTRVLIDQMFAILGFSLDDLLAWGGSLQLNGGPNDKRRINALNAHEVDAVFDEGISTWFPVALAAGYQPLTPEASVMKPLQEMGWRSALIPAGRFPKLDTDHTCIDFSGWPLYTRESAPADMVEKVCAGLYARSQWIPWDDRSFKGVDQIGQETDETPLDVPLHPAAERWYRAHAGKA